MSEQRDFSGGHDGSTAQRDRKEAWYFRRRQTAAQADAEYAARTAELMVRAIQEQVNQEGIQAADARDSRIAELTARAIEAQVTHEFNARGTSDRGQGDMRGGHVGRAHGDMRGSHGGRARGDMRGGRGGYGRVNMRGGRGGRRRGRGRGTYYACGGVRGRPYRDTGAVRGNRDRGDDANQRADEVYPNGQQNTFGRYADTLQETGGKNNLLLPLLPIL
ncbi:hypothetical protein N7491_004404 [Penicillium cf. griseofulvum]|uniref:Uncharacterized protein n=1 Tax=Penicillium cf. griseofulvum TaxID=2972120 RepID=A0A9W9M457_9EURO|nr:hypothetical protein N7472_007093 [Penicillium cf. griseofulvum]KAJ5422975.1 hypothetical protein N7445_011083 [Penicillium cf. griseofulvum]KAJ5433809.1 hypothetical protein N7491_004404 [Penicillium cf. griseofulvum]